MSTDPISELVLLCIEDAPEIRKIFDVFLGKSVARLDFAPDVKSGLEKIRACPYDAVLVDLLLPDGNGLDIVREMRTSKLETPIIVITGHADEAYLMESIRLGVDHFLKKPVTKSELLDVVQRTARTIHQKRELLLKNAIVDTIEDGVVAVDENRRIIFANSAVEKMTGRTRLELISQPVAHLFHQESGEPVAGKPPGDGSELRYLKRSDNTIMPVQTRGSIFRENAEGVVKGLLTFHDVTPIMILRKELQEKYTFHDLVGQSRSIRRVVEMIRDIADTDVNVLVTGESGTGKELVVRAIHNMSGRREHPLVSVNCAALPEQLLESELFGYRKGAFTDAKQDKKGRVAAAEGGTLFLDEIGDMPMLLQPKILRLIQEKEYDVLGDVATKKADIRFITATNQNLDEMVAQKLFREDLYYRLRVMQIEMPPLRDRREDIPLLVRHFLRKFSLRYDRTIDKVTGTVMDLLLQYAFPGNVRELESVMEHAFILTKGSELHESYLPDYIRLAAGNAEGSRRPPGELLYSRIMATLKSNNYDREKTAQQLGIHRTTLWRWLKKHTPEDQAHT